MTAVRYVKCDGFVNVNPPFRCPDCRPATADDYNRFRIARFVKRMQWALDAMGIPESANTREVW